MSFSVLFKKKKNLNTIKRLHLEICHSCCNNLGIQFFVIEVFVSVECLMGPFFGITAMKNVHRPCCSSKL